MSLNKAVCNTFEDLISSVSLAESEEDLTLETSIHRIELKQVVVDRCNTLKCPETETILGLNLTFYKTDVSMAQLYWFLDLYDESLLESIDCYFNGFKFKGFITNTTPQLITKAQRIFALENLFDLSISISIILDSVEMQRD
jgi:hypothetical protein